MTKEGYIPLSSNRIARDGKLNTDTVVWVERLGPNGREWEVESFTLDRYSPARRYRVNVYGDKNGISERIAQRLSSRQ